MFNNRATARWLVLVAFAAVGLLVSGCGDSSSSSSEDGDAVTTTVADASGDDSALSSGQCAEDQPDCADTDVTGDSQTDEPTSEGGGVVDSSSGMIVDGGLTVTEALATDATGTLAVKGHVYDEGSGAALCETLVGQGERYGCAGPLLPVVGLDLESLGGEVIIHDGLTYTESEITVLGEVLDGILVIDPFSS